MAIRRTTTRHFGLDEPIRHPDYHRPVSRRDFLAQGFIGGAGTVIAPSLLGLFSSRANAALSDDITALLAAQQCNIQDGAGKVPFICFDLAGGANIAGSNVMVGKQGGQLDFLTTAGYSKLGIPGDMTPTTSSPGSFVDSRLGLAFHGPRTGQTDGSAFMRGMMTKISAATALKIDGVVIPARSENDTSNNPHNPMYGIAKAGARGSLASLIGSQSSDSGGNSMAPAMMMDPALRPTKVDRASDATGLVDTGELATLLPNQSDTVAVMESIQRTSEFKLANVSTELADDAAAKKLVRCSYVKTAYQADRFGSTDVVDPRSTSDGPIGTSPKAVFTTAEANSDREFEKTASVAKLVVNGLAGAGTISMGGFDYHTGDRMTGEIRDFRAGVCIGACLEYAARQGKPLMVYVFSDGSLSSNGMIDNSRDGLGKGQWTGDNQSTAASFFLVYNPTAKPELLVPGRQLGWFRASGDVETASSPAANAVNLLVETVILNYMALHQSSGGASEVGNFRTLFPSTGLSNTQIDNLTAFAPIATTP